MEWIDKANQAAADAFYAENPDVPTPDEVERFLVDFTPDDDLAWDRWGEFDAED